MAGLILSYGVTGVGKTLDICRCFRGGIVLLTDRDGLRAVQTLDKRTPRHVRLRARAGALAEARAAIQQIRPLAEKKQVTAVLLCVASELAERMLGETLSKVADARQAFQLLHRDFMYLTEDLIEMGVWVVYECHEAQPREEAHRTRPGGPKFPGERLMEDVPYLASMVLRAKYNTKGERVYWCDPSDDLWVAKDRYNVCTTEGPKEQPMDLLALMKKAVENGAA